jgi:membrane protein YdbS with pleckstrin-like domain
VRASAESGRVTAVPERGEQVCLDARPHGAALVRPLLRPLLLAAAGTILVVVGQTYWIAGVLGAAALVVAALLAFRAVLRWDRTRLLLTADRLTVVYGIARRRSASVTLAHAPALELEQGVLGRVLGYGTLVVGDLEVPYVPDARRLRRLLA